MKGWGDREDEKLYLLHCLFIYLFMALKNEGILQIQPTQPFNISQIDVINIQRILIIKNRTLLYSSLLI